MCDEQERDEEVDAEWDQRWVQLAEMQEKSRIRREKIEIPKHRKALISALESIAESLHRIERAIVRAKENPR